MRRTATTGAVSPYAGKATEKLAAADARVREAKAAQRDAESRADAADRRAERLEAALERIGERLDAIERRLDRKAPVVAAKVEERPAQGRVDASVGLILYGVQAIADFVGLTRRQAQYQIEADRLPHFRIGDTICSRRETLVTWLAKCEASPPIS